MSLGAWTLAGCGVAPGFEFSASNSRRHIGSPVHVNPVHAKRSVADHNGFAPSLFSVTPWTQTIRSAFAADRAGASFRRGRFWQFARPARPVLRRLACGLIGGLSGLRWSGFPNGLNIARACSNITCSCGPVPRSSRKRACQGDPKFWQTSRELACSFTNLPMVNSR